MDGQEKVTKENKELSELEKLIKEKVTLSKKLGIMGGVEPKKDYEQSEEFNRINDIDTKLWELIK